MKVNGEAIYKTRARFGELYKDSDKIRYIRSKDNSTFYAIVSDINDRNLKLKSVIASAGSEIGMLGVNKSLNWRMEEGTIIIDIPISLQDKENRPCEYIWVFKIITK